MDQRQRGAEVTIEGSPQEARASRFGGRVHRHRKARWLGSEAARGSPGPAGGARGLAQLRGVLSGTASAVLPWPDLAVGGVASAFAGAELTDDVVKRRLAEQLDAFADWMEAVSVYRALRGTHQ